MKEITKTLQTFIESNFVKKYRFSQSRFSPITKNFLTGIFELMFESHRLLESIDKEMQHIKYQDKIPKSYDYNYMDSNILNEIENMDKNAYVYTFKLQGKEYQIVFVYDIREGKKYSESIFLSRIEKIIMWLYIANTFASHKCSQQMNVFMYFTDLKKKLPTNKKIISVEHANTAFTTSCRTTTEINLYREEEWFKVFIHETFHNLGLDFSSMNENISKNAILSIFPVQSDVNLFETYCEMWAEIMNVMFIVFFSNKNKENIAIIPTLINKTEKYLHYERIFSLFQSIKVLHFFGLSYRELYEKNEKNNISRTHKFKEKRTNVLSYYIIKSIFMFYVNDFIEWCLKHNKNYIDFKEDENTVKKYCEFIQTHHNEKTFLNSVDIMESWFDEKNDCNIECNTLRMSLFEDA